jgi:Mce-associated membrane protein
MAETSEPPTGSPESDNDDQLLLVEEAEAEAAEAEALAAAARARARAARLRRKALAKAGGAKANADEGDGRDGADTETDEAPETLEYTEDDEDIEDEEDIDEEPDARTGWLGRSGGRLPRLSAVAKAAAIILILGFVVMSAYIVWRHNETTERQQRAASILAGAKQGVINMTSLDFSKARDDVQRVIDSSTGEFRDDFQQRAADFTKVVEQSKVVTEGTINAAGIESMAEHSAQVLVSATSRVTNSAGAKDEPRQWRLRVTVTEDGGSYKMSKVEFVP